MVIEDGDIANGKVLGAEFEKEIEREKQFFGKHKDDERMKKLDSLIE